jgi:hypothetical protein
MLFPLEAVMQITMTAEQFQQLLTVFKPDRDLVDWLGALGPLIAAITVIAAVLPQVIIPHLQTRRASLRAALAEWATAAFSVLDTHARCVPAFLRGQKTFDDLLEDVRVESSRLNAATIKLFAEPPPSATVARVRDANAVIARPFIHGSPLPGLSTEDRCKYFQEWMKGDRARYGHVDDTLCSLPELGSSARQRAAAAKAAKKSQPA